MLHIPGTSVVNVGSIDKIFECELYFGEALKQHWFLVLSLTTLTFCVEHHLFLHFFPTT